MVQPTRLVDRAAPRAAARVSIGLAVRAEFRHGVLAYTSRHAASVLVAASLVAERADQAEVHAVLVHRTTALAAEQARLARDLVGLAIVVGLFACHFFLPFIVAGIDACRHAHRQPHVSPQKRLSP